MNRDFGLSENVCIVSKKGVSVPFFMEKSLQIEMVLVER